MRLIKTCGSFYRPDHTSLAATKRNQRRPRLASELFLRHDEAHENRPEVVNDEQPSRRQFGLRRFRAEAAADVLIFEFVKHVLRVGALAVELLDLPVVQFAGPV